MIKNFYYDASQAQTQAVAQLKKQAITLKAQQKIPRINHYREGNILCMSAKNRAPLLNPVHL